MDAARRLLTLGLLAVLVAGSSTACRTIPSEPEPTASTEADSAARRAATIPGERSTVGQDAAARGPEPDAPRKRSSFPPTPAVRLDVFPPIERSPESAARVRRVPDPASSPVPLDFDATSKIFPEEWRDAPVSAQAKPLARTEHDRSVHVLLRSLAKYPPDFLREHLRAVHLLGGLEFSGISAAGTYGEKTVYIANEGVRAGYLDEYLEETFHHEFSSVLLERYRDRFPADRWIAQNSASFAYSRSGVDAVRLGRASQRFDDDLHHLGFLHEYATASIEEDFNSIAELLFAGRPQLWEIGERYPRIAAKIDLAIEFYRSIDARFTRDHFRAFALAAHSE